MADFRRYVRNAMATIGGLACLAGLPRPAAADSAPARAEAALAATPVKVEGTASPGARVRLQMEDARRPGRHFLWFQTGGPPVELSNRTEPELKVTIPAGADELNFLLVVGDEDGLREANVSIPVAVPTIPSAPAAPAAAGEPRADAGDDQVGLVGRRITLNGFGSTPADQLSYRWIQIEGPAVGSALEDGKFLSFIPKMAGRYRFALVVAAGGIISEPDYVRVNVGHPPGASPAAVEAAGTSPAGAGLDALIGSVLVGLGDSPALAGPLAETFQATATRLDLYRTPAEVFGELTRRLDAVIPKDPAGRARWNAAMFEPLTRHLLARLLPLGLDLRTPQGYLAPLTEPQKQELREYFQALATRFESARPAR